jgi:Zn-dependent peptidase ImmA (M78 family)/transcriptional regulator with XRE-family HTH domain
MRPEATFQGSKLRLARLLNGFTKAELADRLEVSRQFIHALEIEAKSPSSDMSAALSLLLKVQPSFFFSPLSGEVREEECHFRSRKSMPDKLADQIIAHGTGFEALVRHLDETLTLPKVDFPHIEVQGTEDIELAAEECRHHWKLGSGPISNMCRVIENAGAVITFFRCDRHEVDALSIARVRPIIVRNTLKESPGRLRFDLGHECGHLVIHQGMETGDDETEAQANRFSSAFLMPRESFKKEFPAISGRLDWNAIYSLKIRWRVSAKAVLRRAKDLGLLNDIQYAAGNRFLNGSGQSKIERYDERIPFEEPELVSAAIRVYLKTFNRTTGELAGRLGITPAMLLQLTPNLDI